MKEPNKWSAECKDFLNKCLAKDVGARPDAATLLKVHTSHSLYSLTWLLGSSCVRSHSLASSPQHPFMNKAGPPGCLLPGLRRAQKLKD
jgi:serine/threonine protein kinase